MRVAFQRRERIHELVRAGALDEPLQHARLALRKHAGDDPRTPTRAREHVTTEALA